VEYNILELLKNNCYYHYYYCYQHLCFVETHLQFASHYKSHSLHLQTEHSKCLYALHLILRSAYLYAEWQTHLLEFFNYCTHPSWHPFSQWSD